jgi:hypothetical protein
MAITHTVILRNLMANSIQASFDTGIGRLAVLSGSAVAAASAQTGTVLATFTLPSDVFAAASGGGIALNAVSNITAGATGTAGSFIFYNTGETAIGSSAISTDNRITGSLGTSGTDMIIDNTSITSGGTLVMSGWTWNAPA